MPETEATAELVPQVVLSDEEEARRRERFPVGAAIEFADLEEHGRIAALDRLREAEPVSWVPALGGWLITGHSAARQLLSPRCGTTVEAEENLVRHSLGRMMLTSDGADHDRQRAPFDGPFRMREVGELFGRAISAEADALLDELAPLGPVYQAGTLSGNPLATAAGLAVLDELDHEVYATIEARAVALTTGLTDALTGAGLVVSAPRAFTLAGLFFAGAPVRNYDDARAADADMYARFFHGMLDRGVYFAPSAFEAMFPSLAHTDADIARTIELAAEVGAALGTNRADGA